MTTWTGVYIHGGGTDHVVVERDGEPYEVLVVDAEVFEHFAYSEDPSWDNWHGLEDVDPGIPYEQQFGGPVIAERIEDGMVNVIDAERWAERREFWSDR